MAEPTIVKRVSLDGLLEGFDADCYAYVKPATVLDKQQFRQAIQSQKNDELADDWQQTFVTDHFISGKIKVLAASGEFELADMTDEHLNVAEVSDRLLLDIMGINLDPKGLSAAAAQHSEPQPNEASTATPSSETSGRT